MTSTMICSSKLLCILTLYLVTLAGKSLAAIPCMDMNGRPVDWFIIIKLPITEESSVASMKNGSAFMYMDVNSQTFQQSDVSLDNGEQAVGYTLKQIYRNYKDIGYGMYNDEHPDGKTSANRGHTKGVVALDSDSGFWLIHSVPKFPNPASESYAWPDSARRNGQSFLCVTLAYQQFEEIGKQLMYMWPSTYDSKMPSSLASNLPSLVSSLDGEHIKDAPYNRTSHLVTKDGQKLISFAKSREFNADLYSTWVAPYFGSNLYTETWQDGRGKLPSCCNMTYQVLNVQTASIDGVLIKETKDHSKWAVTTDHSNQWSCIGGINRQEGQFNRGGGTVCCNLPNVWTAFHSAISTFENCSSDRKRK